MRLNENADGVFPGMQFDSKRWWLMTNGVCKGDKEIRKFFLSKTRNKHGIKKTRFPTKNWVRR